MKLSALHHSNSPSALVAVVLGVLILTTQVPAAQPTAAQTCSSGRATVLAAGSADFADICAGVDAALAFLARHSVTPAEPISIEVIRSIPTEAGPTAAGCYMEQRKRVYVVPYTTFKKSRTWFGVPISRQIYRALAAHETAHAVGACNFKITNPTIQAKEYLAYVTMFSVMPADLRREALKKTKTEGFSTMDRFTPLLYGFDPMRFGAEAYRHFASAQSQTAIIQGVLSGALLQD